MLDDIEYCLEIYKGLIYYYFNTLDMEQLIQQSDGINIYVHSTSGQLSILFHYIFLIGRNEIYE